MLHNIKTIFWPDIILLKASGEDLTCWSAEPGRDAKFVLLFQGPCLNLVLLLVRMVSSAVHSLGKAKSFLRIGEKKSCSDAVFVHWNDCFF